ncbi:MAG: FkbM family methyltransferase [Sphingobacteriales bacterium]|uniref:FkbM family methyltransferase n=1 Tax=Hydrotalea flava TaxID=714549 RepID=UPI000FA50C93|nr:FkbM family methyltransferase [Hydrotalea flava]RTL49097.1 MAG: FkbM family methyltransferase [Sphingobacteriales bacterium]
MFFKKKQKISNVIDRAEAVILKDKENNLYYYPSGYPFSEQVLVNGFSYDSPEDLSYFKSKFRGDILFDIGSNHGDFSLFLAKNFNKIYAFEPDLNNLEILQKNILLNEVKNCAVFNDAISNKNEVKVPFYILAADGHHSLGKVATSTYKKTAYVNCIRLDHFIQNYSIQKIDLMKVDVEGFELEVFEGLGDYLNKSFVTNIFFEISKVPLESISQKASNIGSYLVNRGYQIFDIYDQPYHPDDLDKIYFGNFIAK